METKAITIHISPEAVSVEQQRKLDALLILKLAEVTQAKHPLEVIMSEMSRKAQERGLYPLLREAGFGEVHISPRMVYVDSSKPELIEVFTKKTFIAMIEGIRQSSLESGLMSAADFDKGIADLYRTAEADGVFCYAFFKASAVKNSSAEQSAPGDAPQAAGP